MSLVNTTLIQERLNDVLVQIGTPDAQLEITKRDNDLKQAEASLILGNMICPISQLKNIRPHLGGLKPQEFKQLLSREFYNADVMKTAFCIFGSMYYGQPNNSSLVAPNMRIRYWLKNLRASNLDSGLDTGDNYTADLKNAADFLMVKVPNKMSNNLIHEYFIGVYGTNILRKYLPNFAYVLGGFKCSPPVSNPSNLEGSSGTGDIITWCNNRNININYILYENLEPAIPFRKYLNSCSSTEFLNKYLQVLYALHKANVLIDFTHYDLHHENVVLRKLESHTIDIQYDTENGIEYLKTNSVATIIDFSYSHIAIDLKQSNDELTKRHFGVSSKLAYGIFPGRKFPLHDAYKLLLFSMNEMLASGNLQCFQTAAKILQFFDSSEPAENIISKQRSTYYYLPYTPELGALTNLDLTKYIRKSFPTETRSFISSKPFTQDIVKCDGQNVCTSVSQMLNRIGISMKNGSDSGIPSTVFEFYDSMTTLLESREDSDGRRQLEQGNTELSNMVKSKFDYNLAMKEFNTNYNNNTNLLRDKIRSLKIYSLDGSSPESIFNSKFLEIYQNHVVNVAETLDLSQQVNTTIKAGIYTAETFNDNDLANRLAESLITLDNTYNPFLKKSGISLTNDIKWLDSIKDDPFVKKSIDVNPNLKWFYTGLDQFFYMLV